MYMGRLAEASQSDRGGGGGGGGGGGSSSEEDYHGEGEEEEMRRSVAWHWHDQIDRGLGGMEAGVGSLQGGQSQSPISEYAEGDAEGDAAQHTNEAAAGWGRAQRGVLCACRVLVM